MPTARVNMPAPAARRKPAVIRCVAGALLQTRYASTRTAAHRLIYPLDPLYFAWNLLPHVQSVSELPTINRVDIRRVRFDLGMNASDHHVQLA